MVKTTDVGAVRFTHRVRRLLERRGSSFRFDNSRPGLDCFVQTPYIYRPPGEPFRFKGLRIVVVIDRVTLHAKVIAADAAFDFKEQKGLPKAVHKSKFECDISKLGHIAAANRIEKLFGEMRQIEELSGLTRA